MLKNLSIKTFQILKSAYLADDFVSRVKREFERDENFSTMK